MFTNKEAKCLDYKLVVSFHLNIVLYDNCTTNGILFEN